MNHHRSSDRTPRVACWGGAWRAGTTPSGARKGWRMQITFPRSWGNHWKPNLQNGSRMQLAGDCLLR